MRKYFESTGETGGIVERELLGECTVAWNGYMAYVPAMKLAEEHQPKVTPLPSRQFQSAIVDGLIALGEKVDANEVVVRSAVGTALDHFHGIDGWVSFQGLVVTFDVTLNRQKESSVKTDMVINVEEFRNIASLGEEVAFKIRNRLALRSLSNRLRAEEVQEGLVAS